jgi:flagellar basal-body rod protein FlgG
MMNSLWIAKTGMTAQQTQLDVISHNLANVSTTGFKRNRAEFQDLIYQNLRQVGAQTTEENQLPTGLHLAWRERGGHQPQFHGAPATVGNN